MSLSRSCAARSIYLSRENRLRNGMSSPLPPAKVQLVIEQAVVHFDSIGRESVTGAPEILGQLAGFVPVGPGDDALRRHHLHLSWHRETCGGLAVRDGSAVTPSG